MVSDDMSASLREVLIASRQYGEREFLIYDDERLTFAAHFNQVARLATLLLRDGVRHGDRVAIGMRNYPEWVVSFWACQAIGAVAVTLNAWWTSEELAYAFTDYADGYLYVVDRNKDVVIRGGENVY